MSALPAGVTFIGDWDGYDANLQIPSDDTEMANGRPIIWVANWAPSKWHMICEAAAGRIATMTDETVPGDLKTVAHVLVLPGDDALMGSAGDSERAEVYGMLDAGGKALPVTRLNGREFYAFSIKLSADWQSPAVNDDHESWGSVLQLHSPNGFASPPAFALYATDSFKVALLTGDLMRNGARRNVTEYELINGSLELGQWVSFLLDVTWTGASSGALTLFRRNSAGTFEVVFTRVNAPTLQYDSQNPGCADQHYWRTGYYRSASPQLTSELWLSPLVRGTTQAAVELSAFG